MSGYADGGDTPGKELKLVPGALDDARAFLHDQQHTHTRFERVSELVEGFESPFGLELLSTVHWLSRAEGTHNLNDIVDETYAWNSRKRQFSRRQIGLALDVLAAKMWVDGSRVGAAPA